MRHLYAAQRYWSPGVSFSHLCLIEIIMLLVQHRTQASLQAWVSGNVGHTSSTPWGPQISLALSVNDQLGKIRESHPGFWENTSSEVHSRLLRSFVSPMTSTAKVFTHLDHTMMSNAVGESIALLRVLLPPNAIHIVRYNLVSQLL